ncbi:MAG: phosphoribosylformylglycinamidine synthase subunit PurS [Nitrososphaeraceae archaeon]
MNEKNTSVFDLNVIIQNKDYINDPEGETIYRDLIIKNKYSNIKSVRTAKILKIKINAKNIEEAKKTVENMCEELRIYNPIVSNCKIQE